MSDGSINQVPCRFYIVLYIPASSFVLRPARPHYHSFCDRQMSSDMDEAMELEDGSQASSYDEDDCDDSDDAFEAPPLAKPDSVYAVLTPTEAAEHASKQVVEVTSVLNCDREAAILLLRHFRWDRDKLMDGALPSAERSLPLCRSDTPWRALACLCGPAPKCVWARPHAQLTGGRACGRRRAAYMTDEEAVARKAGLSLPGDPDHSIVHSRQNLAEVRVGGAVREASSLPPVQCSICFEQVRAYSALPCGHPFCNVCYAAFLSHKVVDEGHEVRASRSQHGAAPNPDPHFC